MITDTERRAIFETADFWSDQPHWGILDANGQRHL